MDIDPTNHVCNSCGRPNNYSRLDVRTCPSCGEQMQFPRGAKPISEFIHRRYRRCPSCGYADSRLVTPERLISLSEGADQHPSVIQSGAEALK